MLIEAKDERGREEEEGVAMGGVGRGESNQIQTEVSKRIRK